MPPLFRHLSRLLRRRCHQITLGPAMNRSNPTRTSIRLSRASALLMTLPYSARAALAADLPVTIQPNAIMPPLTRRTIMATFASQAEPCQFRSSNQPGMSDVATDRVLRSRNELVVFAFSCRRHQSFRSAERHRRTDMRALALNRSCASRRNRLDLWILVGTQLRRGSQWTSPGRFGREDGDCRGGESMCDRSVAGPGQCSLGGLFKSRREIIFGAFDCEPIRF
jgi:hypothetical protein